MTAMRSLVKAMLDCKDEDIASMDEFQNKIWNTLAHLKENVYDDVKEPITNETLIDVKEGGETMVEHGDEPFEKQQKDEANNDEIVIKHESILVSPREQLKNANAKTLEELGNIIQQNYLSMVNSKSETGDFGKSLFSRSFHTLETSYTFHKRIQTINKGKNRIVLPPLIIRSEETFIIQLPYCFIAAYNDGPMVPIIIPDKENQEIILQIISKLYNLESDKYINRYNFASLISE